MTYFEKLQNLKNRARNLADHAQNGNAIFARLLSCEKRARLYRAKVLASEARHAGNMAKYNRIIDAIARFNHRENRCTGYGTPEKPATIKQYKPLTEHRMPAVKPFDFSDISYITARHVVNAKVNSARKRGVIDSQNVYLQYYPDMVHRAIIAIMEAQMEADRIASLLPTGYDMPTFDHDETVENVLFSEAWKACGRYAYDIEKRAKEGTAIEHVSDHIKTSTFERKLAERDSFNSFMETLVSIISMHHFRNANTRRNLLSHLQAGKLTSDDKQWLRQLIELYHLTEKDVRGLHYIA